MSRFTDPWYRLQQEADLSGGTRALVFARLAAGEREYGSASWAKPHSELAREIDEELLDVIGWSVLVWDRLNARERQLLAQNLRIIDSMRTIFQNIIDPR